MSAPANPQPTYTAADLAMRYETEGAIFATVQGQRVIVSHDEECTGIYAWPEGVDNARAIASFGEDWSSVFGFGEESDPGEGWPLVARWLNSDGAEGSL